MPKPTQIVNWGDLTDQTLQDRLAERLFGASVDSVSYVELPTGQHVQLAFDNGVLLMFQEGFLGLEE